MLDAIRQTGAKIEEAGLAAQLNELAAKGCGTSPSPVLNGITDLSVPILAAGIARAALTSPFVDGPATCVTLDASKTILREAAAAIAEQLTPVVHNRVGADRQGESAA